MLRCFYFFFILSFYLLVTPLQAAVVTTFSTNDEDSPWHPTKIQQDQRGMIWIGSWNGLYRFDGYHFQSFKPEPGQGTVIDNDRIRGIYKAGGDTLLCEFDEGVYAFDVVKCQFDSIPQSQQINIDQRFTQNDQTFSPLRTITIDGEVYENIQQQFIDRQGNIWLKAIDQIYCVHPNRGHGEVIDDVNSQDIPRCLFRDTEGYYWVCSRNNKQVVLYDANWHRIGYLGTDGTLHAQPTAFAAIYCIYDDGKGTLWLGSKPDGIYRLKRDDNRFKVERIPMTDDGDGLPSNAIYDIQTDSIGTLWLATWDCGIICIDNPHEPNYQGLHYTRLDKLCSKYPADAIKARRILIRDDGTLLAATTRGLLVIDNIYTSLSQMQMRLHRREANRRESLTASALMTMGFNAQNRLFVATESGGVCMLKSDDLHAEQLEFTHFTSRDGLSSDVTFDFAMSPDGRVLVLCPNGVSVIDTDAADIESYGSQFWNTSAPFTECKPQIIGDSLMILAYEKGIIQLPLRELTQQGYSPYLALTDVTIGSEPTRYDIDRCDTIYLNASQRSMTISYAALDLCAAYNSLRYRTRLTQEGKTEGAWSHTVDTHEIMLQDLRPGKYQLQICSSNANGQWTDNVRTVTIVVEPRFFESWYGQLLLWIIFAAIIAAITYTIIYIRRIDSKRHELLETYLALLESTTKEKIEAAATVNAQKENVAETAKDEQSEEQTNSNTPGLSQGNGAVNLTNTHLSIPEQQFMQRLLNYVEENISNCNASLADMAEATATSKSSLTRKTHQLLGVTPADFLKEARLKKARQLLLTTSQSLTEIALACGFSDPKYFSKCFKASTGKTPTEFRS